MPEPVRKTCPHFMHHPPFSVAIPLVKKLRPTVIKALTSGDWLVRLADALKNELDYEPLFVQRDWFDGRGAGYPNNYQGQTYDQWIEACITGLNACAGRHNFFYESYNEVGVSREYLQFEAERTARLKAEFGIRAAVINMGVGWSTSAHVEMAKSAELLDALRDNDGAWCEHSYMMPVGSQAWRGHNQSDLPDSRFSKPLHDIANDRTIYPPTVTDWLTFRAAMTHQAMLTAGYDIPIILTEYGFDDAGAPAYQNYTGGQAIGAWKSCIPYWREWGYLRTKTASQFYGEQLALGEAQMQAPGWEWLLGATVFTVGSDPASTWSPFDILNEDMSGSGVVDDFLIALPAFDIPQQPEPDPEPEPPAPPPQLPATGCWVAAWPDAVYIRSQPDATSAPLGLIAVGEQRQSLGAVKQDEGRLWHKLKDGGYAADWVLLSTDCPLLDEQTPDNGEIPMGTLNLVLRDANPVQMNAVNAPMGGRLFVNLGDPINGAEADVGEHIARFWLDWHAGNPGQDFGNNDTFMQRVSGSAKDIAENTLLESPIFKNYITDHRAYTWVGGAVNEYKKVLNDFYAPHAILSLPINADTCPVDKLGLLSSISTSVAGWLDQHVDSDTRQPLETGLKGCYIGRDVALDTDRAAFWELMFGGGILNAIANYGGVLEMKVKLDKPAMSYKKSEVMRDEDLAWLAGRGFGAIRKLIQIEWRDGHRGAGLTPKQVADSLWLMYQTVQEYESVDVAVMLWQDGESGDWGDNHNLKGEALDLFLKYKAGTQTPPDVDWQPEGGSPAPVAAIGHDTIKLPVRVGDTVTFRSDSTGTITGWLWEINENHKGWTTFETITSAEYTFTATGYHQIRLTVTSNGDSDSDTMEINVEPAIEEPKPPPSQPPVANPDLPMVWVAAIVVAFVVSNMVAFVLGSVL